MRVTEMSEHAGMYGNDLGVVKPVVISCVIVLNIVMNSILIALLVKFAELREDCTAWFMLSLSVSDLAAGCTGMPISAALCSRATPTVRNMTQYLPKINLFCMWFFGFVSQHSQSWVALSKMVAILRPLKYEQMFSRNRCYGIIVFNWIVGAALAASRLTLATGFSTNHCAFTLKTRKGSEPVSMIFAFVFSIVLPVLVLVFATARIFIVLVRVHSQFSAQVQSISGGSAHSGLVTLKAIRSARNILVICFVALALTVPLLVAAVLHHNMHDEDNVTQFGFYFVWLFHSNSFLNSFLYVVLHRSLRHKLGVMFVAVYRLLCGLLQHDQ
jgi:hypothetical protein